MTWDLTKKKKMEKGLIVARLRPLTNIYDLGSSTTSFVTPRVASTFSATGIPR